MSATAATWPAARRKYVTLPAFTDRYDPDVWAATIACTATTVNHLAAAYAEVDSDE